MKLVIAIFLVLLVSINIGCNNTNKLDTANMAGIDLANFSIDGIAIGDAIPASERNRSGVEIEVDGEKLDSLFVTLNEYQGEFLRSGETVSLSPNASPSEIEQLLGKPYWQDLSDGELIMFYEFRAGSIEIQFEFPDSKHLGYVTIANNGVLSDAEQRKSYGVDKPWPPAE
jgi:hypothetical protein